MKKVFSNNEVPHIWARQSQDEGRGSNIFFNGTKIYSYGRHFCMGNIIKPGIVLFTDRTYSKSTAKHLHATRYAVNHMEFIEVPYPENEDLQKNLQAWRQRIQDQIDIIEHPRKKPETKERAKGELSNLVKHIERFFEVTGQSVSKKFIGSSAEDDRKQFILFFEVAKNLQALPGLKKKLEARERAEVKRREKAMVETLEKADKELKLWRAGKKNNFRAYQHIGELPVYLRVDSTQQERHDDILYIETSKGARVSYNAGKKLYMAIQNGHDVKGFNIDGYTVISVNGSLKIGCHEIDIKEVKRFAKAQKW